jgi:hypothetical protein
MVRIRIDNGRNERCFLGGGQMHVMLYNVGMICTGPNTRVNIVVKNDNEPDTLGLSLLNSNQCYHLFFNKVLAIEILHVF